MADRSADRRHYAGQYPPDRRQLMPWYLPPLLMLAAFGLMALPRMFR